MCFDFLYNFCLKHFSFKEELSELWSEMYVGRHVKYQLFLSDFNETRLTLKKKNTREPRYSLRTDRQTWRGPVDAFRSFANTSNNVISAASTLLHIHVRYDFLQLLGELKSIFWPDISWLTYKFGFLLCTLLSCAYTWHKIWGFRWLVECQVLTDRKQVSYIPRFHSRNKLHWMKQKFVINPFLSVRPSPVIKHL